MPGARPLLYLIDGSSYVYRAFHALPPLTSPRGVPTQAAYGFTTMLLKLVNEVSPQYLAVVFDAPGKTFRDELYADYKANRPPAPDDLKSQIPLIHDIVDGFRICKIAAPGVEADDVIATLVARHASEYDIVVVTGDKDLMQLVGPGVRLWDTMRDRWTDAGGVREKFGVDPGQVTDVMALMGDAVDNVPGVKGIGPKTATALIARFGSLENLLAHLDEVPDLDLRGAAKVAERLIHGVADARLSRQLVSLEAGVKIDVAPSDLEVGKPDVERLREIFQELGFHRLLDQLALPRAQPQVEVAEVTGATARERLVLLCDGAMSLPIATIRPAGGMVTTPAERLLVADGAGAVLSLSLSDPATVEAVRQAFSAASARMLGYDLKRVRQGLAAAGVDLPAAGFDIMVASYIVDPTASHSFESISSNQLGRSVSGFGEDAKSTAAGLVGVATIADRLAQQIAAADQNELFEEVETPLVDILSRIESRGMALDVEHLARMSEEFRGRLDALMSEIHALAGREFNINSPPQLREILFTELGLSTRGVKKGKTGYSTDVDVLTKLSVDHPLPAKILEYRALSKLESTYVDALPAAVNPETGRLHTTLHQTVAATGRLSSSDPNLQNIPIRGEDGRRVREAFIAPAGRVLIAADYSQIELRVLAHLSGDPVLRESFHHGEDIHTRTAAEVFGVIPGTVSSEMRRAAKVINFGILYGMGPQRLARELGIALPEARKYIDSYFERYGKVREFMESVLAGARERGFVSTILGRRRPVPELLSGRRGAIQAAERIATNTPLQGSAADIIKLAMVAVERSLIDSGLDAFMVLQIHDELLVESAVADQDDVCHLVEEKMASAIELSVPLVVDVGLGRSWAEAH